LWKKIRRGLSAGRVQSPALRMIVERELEIEAFKTREYWSITAKLAHEKQAFKAKLTHDIHSFIQLLGNHHGTFSGKA
jgi:DNA topoisomerase-1